MFTTTGVPLYNTFYFTETKFHGLSFYSAARQKAECRPGLQTVEGYTATFSPEFTGQRAQIAFLTTPLTLNITVSTKHLLHVTTKYFSLVQGSLSFTFKVQTVFKYIVQVVVKISWF